MKTFQLLLIPLLLLPTLAAETPTRDEQTVLLDATGVRNLGIETAAAEESVFERGIRVLGEIDHTCESHAVLSSRVAGRIIEVLAHEGDFVATGDVLLRVESRQPGDPPPVIELRAPGEGLVIRSEGHLGAPVETDAFLMEILDLRKVWAVAKVPQDQAAMLSEGLAARIHVPALGPEERAGVFLRPGVAADSGMGTVDAIFELSNPGNVLRPGMRAELSVVATRRDGVLSIPRESLQGDRTDRFVFIKDYELENAFVRMPVTVGEMSGERVEILTGLFPGDEVVTRGSYALAFAGKGSVSLKEALDAAHGHPHNEDGSEMSKEQIAAGAGDDHGHDHGGSGRSPLTLFLAITCGVLFVLLVLSSLRRKPQPAPQS